MKVSMFEVGLMLRTTAELEVSSATGDDDVMVGRASEYVVIGGNVGDSIDMLTPSVEVSKMDDDDKTAAISLEGLGNISVEVRSAGSERVLDTGVGVVSEGVSKVVAMSADEI